jgi:parvulin-like peptidyl-prolyl isomerase
MKKGQVLLLAVFCVLFAGARVSAEDFVAKVGDKTITAKEFHEKYSASKKFFKFRESTKENVLDDIIKLEVGLLEAKKLGLEKDPIIMDQIKQVLYQGLIDKQLGSKFKALDVTDAEAKKYYAENPEVRTSQIQVSVRTDASSADDAKALAKIKEIEKKVKENVLTFTEIATQYSEGVGTQTGGDMGWQSKDKLDPVYYNTAKKMKQGEVSNIIRSQFGYHIVKLTDVKKYEESNIADTKRNVFDEKRVKLFNEYMDSLKKKYKVTINKSALK